MKRIGILSDTHGTFDAPLRDFFADVDELWHAGDFGGVETADVIAAFKPLRGVYGNIDGGAVRLAYPRWQLFGRYERGVEAQLRLRRPKIFVSGHSHILKVIYDRRNDWLHINPGAAGLSGFHQVRTAVRLTIDGADIRDLEVGEWPRRLKL